MDRRRRAEPDLGSAARRELEDALDAYLRGKADLEKAARSVGMEPFDFLKEAGSTPDPVAPESGSDLPTFVRRRDEHR